MCSSPSVFFPGSVQGSRSERERLQVRHDEGLLPAGKVRRVRSDHAIGSGEPSAPHQEGQEVAHLVEMAQGPVVRPVGHQVFVLIALNCLLISS